jgi:methionine sulfoxide reductase heme-binding subunit
MKVIAQAKAAVMPQRRFTPILVIAGLLLGAAVAASMLSAHGFTPEGWQLAARYTARTSFLLFLWPYLASSLTRLLPNALTRTVLRERRGLGLAFAGAHFVHLAALVTFLQVSGETPSPVTLALGGFGYVLVALMAATSNDASVRLLGRNWVRLHAFALHYVWFIFVATYAGRIAKHPDMSEYVVLISLAFAALAVRLAAMMKRRAIEAAT